MFDKNKVNWIFEYDDKIEPSRQTKKRNIIWGIMNENGDRTANAGDNNYNEICIVFVQ